MPNTHGLLLPPGEVEQVWEHNLTFSSEPTPQSEAAWASIIPIGRGFIHQPELAPFVSSIAVFHQLHCLHSMRVAYYFPLQESESVKGSMLSEDFLNKIGSLVDREHLRHCFDYLRRALMCAADTNLEDVSHDNRITTGWGSKRRCRSYEAVKKYAETWADSSDTGII